MSSTLADRLRLSVELTTYSVYILKPSIPKQPCNQKEKHLKIYKNNLPYRDRELKANDSREVIKINT